MPVTVRHAIMHDADKLLEWRNDPETIRFSTTNTGVSKDEHRTWLEGKLKSEETMILIGCDSASGEEMGVVRFDAHDEHFWIVSINLAPTWRGRKMAAPLLDEAVAVFGNEHTAILTAYVKQDNIASRKVFERCGFALYEENENQLTYMNKVLIINEIEAVRSRNNVNWINLMRLAFRVAPHEAEEIFKNVNKDDGTIAALLNTLTRKMPK